MISWSDTERAVRSEHAGGGVLALVVHAIRPHIPITLLGADTLTRNQRPGSGKGHHRREVGGGDEENKKCFHNQKGIESSKVSGLLAGSWRRPDAEGGDSLSLSPAKATLSTVPISIGLGLPSSLVNNLT